MTNPTASNDSLSLPSREEMTNFMLAVDITDIEIAFSNNLEGHHNFLISILRGDEGWTQYNQLTDEEIVELFNSYMEGSKDIASALKEVCHYTDRTEYWFNRLQAESKYTPKA